MGDREARLRAQDWVFGWIERFGNGTGAGWTPDLTGCRLIRWINHAILILNGRTGDDSDLFFRALGQQVIFLSRRWKSTAPGLPRFEALTGLIYAGLALTGMEQHADPAIKALARECETRIDPEGAIATRNPQELLEVLTLLNWACEALAAAGRAAPGELLDAIARIAPPCGRCAIPMAPWRGFMAAGAGWRGVWTRPLGNRHSRPAARADGDGVLASAGRAQFR